MWSTAQINVSTHFELHVFHAPRHVASNVLSTVCELSNRRPLANCGLRSTTYAMWRYVASNALSARYWVVGVARANETVCACCARHRHP